MSEIVTIYGLQDPFSRHIRYIGQTVDIKQRFAAHLSSKTLRKTDLQQWIAELNDQHTRPALVILEVVEASLSREREAFWIKHYDSEENPLYNKRKRCAVARQAKSFIPMAVLNVQLPRALRNRLAEAAIEQGRSMKDIILRALDREFSRLSSVQCVSRVPCGTSSLASRPSTGNTCKI